MVLAAVPPSTHDCMWSTPVSSVPLSATVYGLVSHPPGAAGVVLTGGVTSGPPAGGPSGSMQSVAASANTLPPAPWTSCCALGNADAAAGTASTATSAQSRASDDRRKVIVASVVGRSTPHL